MPEPPMMPRTACVMLAPRRWKELCQFYRRFEMGRATQLRRLRSAKLACDHELQGRDRLEILRRDLVLRDGEIELGFDTEHQIDHVHRGQPDVDQRRIRG